MFDHCSGESSSSSGSDAVTDPLERMALDVGMLDRQYRKLMDRQKQTHIVVGGTYSLRDILSATTTMSPHNSHLDVRWNMFVSLSVWSSFTILD